MRIEFLDQKPKVEEAGKIGIRLVGDRLEYRQKKLLLATFNLWLLLSMQRNSILL